MSWAKFAKESLQKGETVQIRPRGHSMTGKVNDGFPDGSYNFFFSDRFPGVFGQINEHRHHFGSIRTA